VTLGTGGLASRIDDLQIVVHYEGCGKKPLSYERASERFSITGDARTGRRRSSSTRAAWHVPTGAGAVRPVRFCSTACQGGLSVACP
jgi:hypothetical protein